MKLSNRSMSPAMIIARKHQSAPKAHWADAEIRKAAEEIDGGRYIPDVDATGESSLDGLGLALGLGAGGVAQGQKPTLEDFRATRDMNELSRHPRVIEAMERMKQEIEDASNPQEAIEKAWMLHEMTERSVQDQKWDGQERWEGKENEAMRIGEILSPQVFHARLVKVIGRERVLLSPHAVKTSPEAKSARCGLYIRNPEWSGESEVIVYKQAEAADLRRTGEKELVKAKRLRAAGQNAEADRAFSMAGQMAQTATEILMELSTNEQLAPKEFLRVGTLQWPLGSEWMVMNFNEYGVPTTAKYLGWRTALLTMIRTKTITEKEAHKAFPVGSGPAADWYREQLQMLRNDGATVN
jgi:hypothetical protein